jgi:SAF domain.
VAILCIIVIGGAASATAFLITRQIKQEYQTLLQEAYQDMEENQREVYVATSDINSGEVIKKENVEKKRVYSSQPQISYITKEQIGKVARIGIPAGTQILNGMVAENNVSSMLRETEYQVINVNSNIMKNDTVDVRIFYPDGESFVILAKKEIKGYSSDTLSVFLWLEEDELLRMSAAIVDAALYTGSRLYVTKYIEPNIQEASVITYTPSLSILSLIESDPNIVNKCSQELNRNIRKALENRLSDCLNTDVAAINWNVGSNLPYTAGKQNTSGDLPGKKEDRVEADATKEQTPIPTPTSIPTPIITPTLIPQVESDKTGIEYGKELGSNDYFFYAKNNTSEGEIEYGN